MNGMLPHISLVQDCLIPDGMDVPDCVKVFTHDDLRNAPKDIHSKSNPYFMFASLQTAAYLNNAGRYEDSYYAIEYSKNWEGVYFQHHFWSSYIDDDLLLNPTCIYMPFGNILGMVGQLKKLFGDHIFIKPDSGGKSFTGFSCNIDELAFETMALRQTSNIHNDELCMISAHCEIYPTEYRAWIVSEKPVTFACYGWTDDIDNVIPDGVHDLANRVCRSAFSTQYCDGTFVADFCKIGDDVKLIEVNCMATSGWYDGIDVEALNDALGKRGHDGCG